MAERDEETAGASHLPYLTPDDVARIWTEERDQQGDFTAPMKASTVWSYVKESAAMVGSKPGRYADNPVPYVTRRGQRLLFVPGPGESVADVEAALRAWYQNRPGRGAGGGRRRS